MALSKAKKAAEALPNYPGRKQAEKVSRAIVGTVGKPLVRRASTAIILRCLGYWTMWNTIRDEGAKNPRAEAIDRGLVGRAWAFEVERDIREVFGVPVDALTQEIVAEALAARPATDRSAGDRTGAEGDEVTPAPERRRRTAS